MNCRIELPSDDQQRFSPNLDYLVTLLTALAPDEIPGSVTAQTGPDGIRLDFAGQERWSAVETSSRVIPRWMFCNTAFRELVAARVTEFMEIVESIHPGEGRVQEDREVWWQPRWAS